MKRAKISYAILLVITLSLVWYFFIKKEDYIIRFPAKSSPGAMMTLVENWSLINKKNQTFTYKNTHKTPYNYLTQQVQFEGRDLHLFWEFNSVNDSVSQVKVGIVEKENSLYNRLTVPFSNTAFKTASLELITDFKRQAERFVREEFRVHSIQIDTVPDFDFAYVALKDVNMNDKGLKMMKHNPILLEFLTENNITLLGNPIITINKWNKTDNIIDLKYGFPIQPVDSFPISEQFKFEKISSAKAIRAIYNGNYMDSDMAWFAIDEYAKRRDIPIHKLPIEIFKDNPVYGGNELEWVAEIYVPKD